VSVPRVLNGLVLVTQTRALITEGRPFGDALREACIGRVQPKILGIGWPTPRGVAS
jgi:cobalt-zinc-cadmium resistance protein CzcA